ncbi:MAG: DUF1080 domain-containing protein [Planctomycetota bacterium]|nr:DUF1080 domain-containing protein [Planctomycetota bacterium]
MAIGHEDTPYLPGGQWTVHDGRRPQPRIIDPGTPSTQKQSGRPPSDALVLFDGSSLGGWESSNEGGGPAKWKLEGGFMEVVPGTGNIGTKEGFGDCQLHVEWAEPAVIKGEDQGRGNSGVFLMGRYEIQVLDCFENPTYPDGATGSIYGQYPPLVNACLRPGEWQTYDVLFVAPRFDGQSLVAPAYMTILQNGVVVQHHRALQGPTCHGWLARYVPHAPKAPLILQDHGDLVRFRNIWIRPLDFYAPA